MSRHEQQDAVGITRHEARERSGQEHAVDPEQDLEASAERSPSEEVDVAEKWEKREGTFSYFEQEVYGWEVVEAYGAAYTTVALCFDEKDADRIVLDHELARLAEARVAELEAALRAITSGHCEDKRLHWLLPYEPVIYCECGWRMEVSLTPEEPR